MKIENKIVRIVLKSDEFDAYFQTLDDRIRSKYDYAIQLMQTQKVVSEKFVKKIRNTAFYEVRVSVATNEYRTMLITTDHPNFMEATRVVLLNSFLKKDSKQYKKEIKKAQSICKNIEE
jgi:phage-related protein